MRVKNFFLVILIIIALGGIFWVNNLNKSSKNKEQRIGLDTNKKTATLIIDDSYQKPLQYILAVDEESTVYSLLTKTGLELETKKYSFGLFVEGINGVKGGKDNKYWIYYLNNILGQVSADSQKVAPGDEILWRLEKNKF